MAVEFTHPSGEIKRRKTLKQKLEEGIGAAKLQEPIKDVEDIITAGLNPDLRTIPPELEGIITTGLNPDLLANPPHLEGIITTGLNSDLRTIPPELEGVIEWVKKPCAGNKRRREN